ncbi:pilin [Micromonospora yangpuensis]|uniref:TrbC/VIRB2 family protein n=1 Tax=Micromonospora yangpuensis TaxID=683228 RepID=A0A1C6U4D0_9ACTN|nr:pilin [Micromonospora yangpuensis]GGL93122.1 hypothetical protein GCM10012279_08560 [Micromonospora yangpuensis]SCL48729.1 hypothetical protein GA0070617_0961 [Micromonospora yangpuensis]
MLSVPIFVSVRPLVIRRVVRVGTGAVVVVSVLSVPGVAQADPVGVVVLAANSLPVVIANLRNLLMGLLAGIATLFLVLAGVYWATAGGDPSQVERAKSALRNALVGYGLAVLAPVLLQLIQGVVGG